MSRKHGFVILAVFGIILGLQTASLGQYGGGTLQYVVRDKKNRIIDASKVEVIKNEPASYAASIRPAAAADLPVSNFAIAMGFGLPLLELSLKLNGDVMNLRFVNITEMDQVLDSPPFQSGTFEIDLDKIFRHYPPDKSSFNTTGLKWGNKLILQSRAQDFMLIDAKNWRKVDDR